MPPGQVAGSEEEAVPFEVLPGDRNSNSLWVLEMRGRVPVKGQVAAAAVEEEVFTPSPPPPSSLTFSTCDTKLVTPAMAHVKVSTLAEMSKKIKLSTRSISKVSTIDAQDENLSPRIPDLQGNWLQPPGWFATVL